MTYNDRHINFKENLMSVIGIIGAMEEEVAALKEKMQISGVLKRLPWNFTRELYRGNRW